MIAMIAVLAVGLVGLLLLGHPMKVPLLAAAGLVLWLYFPGISLEVLPQQVIGGVKPAALAAVPMFVFAAEIMTRGQASDRLLDAVGAFVGHLRGGLPITTAVGCTAFGALSGSTQATVVAVGGPMRPRMIKAGYPDSFATALVINASDIALLIPPSIGMILYGVATGTSIGELFVAGVGPGLLVLALFCVYCWIAAIRFQVQPPPSVPWPERWATLRRAALPMGFPVIVIGGIYGGIFSPTEAAAVSVAYALVLEIGVYRDLTPSRIPELALSTGLVTAVVFVLVGAGAAFSWVISFAEIPAAILGDVLGLTSDSGYWTILIATSAAFFVGCMFVDPIVVILIVAPILHPIAVGAGIDPVHVGVLATLQVAIGSATPPFGCDIFTAIAVFRRPYLEVIRGTPPFIGILLSATALLIAFPQVTLFLRDLAFG